MTHNCWKLTYLSLEDLYLITDDVFFFDYKRDGRQAANDLMLKSLTELNISQCPLLSDRGVGGISSRCEKLKNLHLSGLPLLTDEAATYIVCEPLAGEARGQNLVVLNLSFCTTLTDKAVEHFTKACVKLENINLSGCVLLTDDAVLYIALNCSHVQALGLGHCKRLTDRCICTLADYLWLEDLDISGCSRLTDDGLEVLSMEFTGMAVLNISSCGKLTDNSIDAIARHMINLNVLKAWAMTQVSDLALDMLAEKFPKVRFAYDHPCFLCTYSDPHAACCCLIATHSLRS